MDQSRLQYLFKQYFDKTASIEEQIELSALVGNEANRDKIMKLFGEAWDKYEGDGMIITPERTNEMLNQILWESPESVNKINKRIWWRVAAAAAILIFLAGGYLFLTSKKYSNPPIVKSNDNDINPGSYKARLTLSDGSTINLDSTSLGELATQGTTLVISKDGQLVYQSNAGDGSLIYNTVTTSKGETYTMTLADGSKVWLNSASSIRFPVAFPGRQRRIEVTGEVYVKVAKNPDQPFIATADGMEVMALGTEFNINSYGDEDNASTTLIEGSVKVTNGTANTLLKPGQQTIVNNNGQLTTATAVNIDEIVAWKEGWFHFESADLKTILRQLARWYDVEIIYEGQVKKRKFFTVVKRSSTLKSVLEMLQDNDINYRIEGKKLIVKSG